ncbi:MAG: winged helix-turn-helix transcriptional regulator [Xanthobacteraceae bacterium]
MRKYPLRASGRFLLERRFYSMSPPRAEYVLTAKGRELGPIVGAMRDWGRKYTR